MKQVFIMLVGFSRSGKTTLADKIIKEIPELIKIDSDSILEFLTKTYPIFQDGDAINGKSYKLKQISNKYMQMGLISALLENNYSVLLDSCNIKMDIRKKILYKVKESGADIQTIIIRHKINEDVLYENIRKADDGFGGSNNWKEMYEKVQKPNFDEPIKDEVDYLLLHENNTEHIISEIKNIIRK